MDDVMRALTRRNNSILLRCFAEVSQKVVADRIGVSEATISSIKSDQLERFAAIVAACGLKLVPITAQTYDESFVEALKTIAVVGLGRGAPVREEGDGS